MTRRTRTFSDVTGLRMSSAKLQTTMVSSPSVSVNGPTYKVLAQVNQSDLAFVRERARAIDAEVWMKGNTLNAEAAWDSRWRNIEDDLRQRAARVYGAG